MVQKKETEPLKKDEKKKDGTTPLSDGNSDSATSANDTSSDTPYRQRDRDTAVLSSSRQRWRRVLNQQQPNGTATLGEQREVILVIRGMIERVMLREEKPIVLGRFDLGSKADGQVDLTTYGAIDRGVSREHAKLHLKDDRLYVTDLGSTNGTFLGGKKLTPNRPEMLRKGDELLLGRLAIQVLFH